MGKTSISDWDRKWKIMMDRENEKKMQREIFREKLKEKRELDESIECTFHPKIRRKWRNNSEFKKTKQELLKLVYPIITYEESILRDLKKIEDEEESNKEELIDILCSAMSKFPDQDRSYFLNFYRDERLKDMWDSKTSKWEIVSKLQELERRFNVLCSTESVDPKDLSSVGFEIDNCRKIKDEILKSTQNQYSLKDRSKVSSEFEEILTKVNISHDPRNTGSSFSNTFTPSTNFNNPNTINGLYNNNINNNINNNNFNYNNNININNFNNNNNSDNYYNNYYNNSKGYKEFPLDYPNVLPSNQPPTLTNRGTISQILVPRDTSNPNLSSSNNPYFKHPVYLRHN